MRKWRRWLVGLIGLAALVFATRWLASPRPIAVEAAVAERGAVEDVVANSEGGTVRSRAEARLGVERAGRVARIVYREGARVRAGTVVLALETSTATTRLEAARRDFEAADAAHEAAHAAE